METTRLIGDSWVTVYSREGSGSARQRQCSFFHTGERADKRVGLDVLGRVLPGRQVVNPLTPPLHPYWNAYQRGRPVQQNDKQTGGLIATFRSSRWCVSRRSPAPTGSPLGPRGTKEMMQLLSSPPCMPSLWLRGRGRPARRWNSPRTALSPLCLNSGVKEMTNPV